MIISRDVVLRNDKNFLKADVIEVNIETKAQKYLCTRKIKVNMKSLN